METINHIQRVWTVPEPEMYDSGHGCVSLMLLESNASFESWVPQSASEHAQVRDQLKHILAHPLFNQSKRYPVMLRYVVEQTLLGNMDQLKERTIGIEIFDREPLYDPSADPVVRFTASEIRKRLAQYYVERAHSGELRIDLPLGSYAAVFHPCQDDKNAVQAGSFPEHLDNASPQVSQIEHGSSVEEAPAPPSAAEPVLSPARHRTSKTARALTVLFAGIVGLCLGYLLHRPATPVVSPMDQFWSPITSAAGVVTVCVGVPVVPINNSAVVHAASPDTPDPSFWNDSSHLAISDVIALTHLTTALDVRGKGYRITAASNASFFQLREGPIILIGAFDNPWTMRLMQNLRYTFIHQTGAGSGVGIVDSHNPAQSHWFLPFSTPSDKLSQDYGVVARFHDPTTGQPVVLVAGLGPAGTEAAGEILSNRALFVEFMKTAPRNWDTMNMEVVVATQVIDDHPGPPKILAAEYW